MKNFFGYFLMMVGTMNVAFGQANPDIFTYKIGAFEISLLSEGQQSGKTSILLGASPEMLQKCAPDGTFPNAVNAFLLRTSDKIILIDAGYGRKLFDNLQSLGVTADQVNVVLITHMHGDHIGGLLRDGKVAFPGAEVYLAQPEHDYWSAGSDAKGQNARAVIAAYKDKLHLFQPVEPDAKTNNVIPGIRGIAAYGHTPGHTLFLVESGKEKMLVWADLTHAMAIQMPYPQVAVTYDVDPNQAIVSREKILQYVTKNKIQIAGMHIAFPAMGKVTKAKAPEGYVFTPFTK